MPDNHAARREKLRGVLAARDIPAALISSVVNVRYLTGFTGSNAALVVRADGKPDVFATDGRYRDQAAAECPDLEIVVDRNTVPALLERTVDSHLEKLAIETHVVTLDGLDLIRANRDWLETPSLDRAVERLRAEKDDTELDYVRTACAISCRALDALLETPLVGRTEREIARDLEQRMYDEGAEAIAFPTIVAAGENSALPHHRANDRPVQVGDFLTIDFGARYAGYNADCTRTVVVGAEPAGWQREIYEIVRAAQEAGRKALVPGTALSAVDAAARDLITDAGYGEQFAHGLGHGIGLEVHEEPFFSKTAEGKLGARASVTVEPGIYLPGRGGVRIEDTVIVNDGRLELLTPTTKDLRVVY
ncbi:MAG TPA: aminopeptidase P family protein [Actinopolymorphaceae bacterium]|jgi:Xaa-Pro aminopeptidase